MSSRSLSLVLFDLDGTLRYNEPRGFDVFHRYVEELGFELAPHVRRAALRWLYSYWAQSPELQSDMEESGGRDKGEFWMRHARRHLEQLQIPDEDIDRVSEALMERFKNGYQPVDRVFPDAPQVLRALREQGYRLGLVSNRHDPLDELAEALDLAWAFEFTLAAGQVGWWKPDPRLLQRAVEIAGCEPEQALYVGDNYFADVIGARAAGMPAILVDPEDLFPDADCPVIRSLAELPDLLQSLS